MKNWIGNFSYGVLLVKAVLWEQTYKTRLKTLQSRWKKLI